MSDHTKVKIAVAVIVLLFGFSIWAVEVKSSHKVDDSAQSLIDAYAKDMYQRDVDAVASQRAGCDRTNGGLREPLYGLLTHEVREMQRKGNAAKVRFYEGLIDDMVAAAAAFPLKPGSPLVDCQLAYPPPAPPE